MSSLARCISIPVDITNPGQFFACCGLLELADRRWRDREVRAHFETQCFILMVDDPTFALATLLTQFAGAKCNRLDPDDDAASPLQLLEPFNLRLDWWWKPVKANLETERLDLGGGDKLKTWAGRQCGPLVFRLMKEAAAKAAPAHSPLDHPEAVFDSKDGKAKKKTTSPFYFDSRREGTSLDLGFSPDEQSMSVEAYPAVESLALVGLQRFRPYTNENARPRSFVYTAWAEPLSATVAAAAVCGTVLVRSCGSFRFTKPSRGGEYVTMFSRATRERSKNV